MTEHFTLEEFIVSPLGKRLGIPNNLPQELMTKAEFTLAGLERVRVCLGNMPINITSGFRCKELNASVGGSSDSQHLKAEAVDFVCPKFGTPKAVAQQLASYVDILGIDQLILEGGWVHVSFALKPRKELLTLVTGKYIKGIV